MRNFLLQRFLDPSSNRSGFAVPAVLLLSPLLLLLAFSSIQLNRFVQEGSQRHLAQSIARQNAKFALQIAIAQLQKYAGRDQTVSCRSDILASNRHKYFTTIYQTEETQGAMLAGAPQRKVSSLPAVLVSGNECYDLLKMEHSSEYPEGYFHADSDGSELELVHLDSGAELRVPLVRLDTQARMANSYAYLVADEGLKARVGIDVPSEDAGKQELLDSVRAAAFVQLGTLGSGRLPQEDTPDQSQYITLESLAAGGEFSLEELDQFKHDISTSSQFLLCDSLNGGLKKNLTIASHLEHPRFIDLIEHDGSEYEHENPVFLFKRWCFPGVRDELTMSHYPSAPWELVRSYLRRSDLEPELSDPDAFVLSHLGSEAHKMSHYWESRETSYIPQTSARLVRRSPITLRFQISVDYTLEDLGEELDSDSRDVWHRFRLRQHFIPYVGFWNPYNLGLVVAESIQFKMYPMRGFSGGSYDSLLHFHFSEGQEWKAKQVGADEWEQGLGAGTVRYPYGDGSDQPSVSQLNACTFTVPPFTLAAGETCSFSAGGKHQEFKITGTVPNKLERSSGPINFGYSFSSKNLEFMVKKGEAGEPAPVPQVTLQRFPALGGDSQTRLQVTNSSSFQRLYWNLGETTEKAGISFKPTTIQDSEAIPQTSAQGSSSPKLTALLTKKWPLLNPSLQLATLQSDRAGREDANAYQAPWALFYHHNAARYGALGSDAEGVDSFASAPTHHSGVVIGQSPLHQPELDGKGRPFVGAGDSYSNGSLLAIQNQLPHATLRLSSIAHMMHMNLGKWLSNYNAQQSNASATDAATPTFCLGNSFAPPHVPLRSTTVEVFDAKAYSSANTSQHCDHSFLYNHALWDRYFLSGHQIGEVPHAYALQHEFPVRHLMPIVRADLETFKDPHLSASQLMLEGGFNINSTSVKAWEMVLSASQSIAPTGEWHSEEGLSHFSRFSLLGSEMDSSAADVGNPGCYDGTKYRALNSDEIQKLAQAIVEQNRNRGPAASLSQFVNRNLVVEGLAESHQKLVDLSDVGYSGRIQSAINACRLNGDFHDSQASIPVSLIASSEEDYRAGKVNPESLSYHSGYGCPATVTQADILYRIGHRLSARSDTFCIRAYGECRSHDGKLLAKAYAQATVQRCYEYVGSDDAPELTENRWQLEPYVDVPTRGHWRKSEDLSSLSRQYGRRFKLVEFRWLHPDEI